MTTMIAILNALTFANYSDGVRISAQLAKPMARAIANALPHDADAAEKAAAKVVVERADRIDDTLNERQDVTSLREPFLEHGMSWTGLQDALVAKTRIPAKHSDVGARAQVVLDKVGFDGTSMLRLEAPAAWSEGDRRYRRIVELGLEDEIVALVGSDQLVAVKKSVAALGDAIGAGKTRRETPSSTGLQDALLALSRAVGKYCRLLAAKVDEDDPASVERFRKAVAPIDEYRSRSARGGTEPTEPSTPAQPELPPVTPAGPSIGGSPFTS